jgi:hypothetical protein
LLDEAESLRVIEPLHCTYGHSTSSVNGSCAAMPA